MGINYAPGDPGDSGDHVAEAPPEPTPKEIADACREVLNEEECKAIEEAESTADAIEQAMSYLQDAGIEDPEAFLMEKGILEKQFTEKEVRDFVTAMNDLKTFEPDEETKRQLKDLGLFEDDEPPKSPPIS